MLSSEFHFSRSGLRVFRVPHGGAVRDAQGFDWLSGLVSKGLGEDVRVRKERIHYFGDLVREPFMLASIFLPNWIIGASINLNVKCAATATRA